MTREVTQTGASELAVQSIPDWEADLLANESMLTPSMVRVIIFLTAWLKSTSGAIVVKAQLAKWVRKLVKKGFCIRNNPIRMDLEQSECNLWTKAAELSAVWIEDFRQTSSPMSSTGQVKISVEQADKLRFELEICLRDNGSFRQRVVRAFKVLGVDEREFRVLVGRE